jgi:diguanylate cyclase (GGDEF)-like protein
LTSQGTRFAHRFLVVEAEGAATGGLERAISDWVERRERRSDDGAHECRVVRSLAELAAADLASHDIAVCSMGLPDGTGIDALCFLRNARPALPVVLVAARLDAALIDEAIAAGAIDCCPFDAGDHDRLHVCLDKCLARRRVLAEHERLHGRLSGALCDLVDEISRLSSMVEQLESVAVTDELTGLGNRRQLNVGLRRAWREAMEHRHPVACLMVDVDRFKIVNDTFGHQTGDTMLFLLGRVMRSCCRANDVVARYGGDEFCAILPGVSPEEARSVGERMAEAFHTAAATLAGGVGAGVSIGVAHTSLRPAADEAELLRHADEALYEAKRSGRRLVMGRAPSGRPAEAA